MEFIRVRRNFKEFVVDCIDDMMPERRVYLEKETNTIRKESYLEKLNRLKAERHFNNLVDTDEEVRCAFMLVLADRNIKEMIIKAFKPITDLLAGLSYPVCYIMLATGILLIMSGNKSKGIDILKWACIGFLGMQFLPVLMGMLVKIGEAMVM